MENVDALDCVPVALESGSLSLEKAAMKVMEIIYTNPGRFGILDMDEDARSDFLLDAIPKFRGLLERYDKSFGPLGAYVYHSIPGLRMTWERRQIDAESAKAAARASVRNIYEDVAERKALAVAEPLPAKNAFGGVEEGTLFFKRIFENRKNLLEPKKVFYGKRSALILALKSAWYIDDAGVKKLSACCGCSSEVMAEALAKVKDCLVAKSEKRQKLCDMRDRAWYFVCKYRQRLLSLDSDSEEWKKVKRKLDYHLASWKSKNRVLHDDRMRVSPGNDDLARIFKIKRHRVSLFLKRARRMAESGEPLFPMEISDGD